MSMFLLTIAAFLILAVRPAAFAAEPAAGAGHGGDPPSGDPPSGDPPAGDPPAGDPPSGDPPSGGPPAAAPALTEYQQAVQELVDDADTAQEVYRILAEYQQSGRGGRSAGVQAGAGSNGQAGQGGGAPATAEQRIEALTQQVLQLQQSLQQRDQRSEQTKKLQAWQSQVRQALDGHEFLAGAPDDEVELLTDLAQLHLAKNKQLRPAQPAQEFMGQLAGIVNRRVEAIKTQIRQEAIREYIDGKIDARAATRDEHGGRPAGQAGPEPIKGGDLESGALAERVKREMAARR